MNSFAIMPPPTRPSLPCRKSSVEIGRAGPTRSHVVEDSDRSAVQVLLRSAQSRRSLPVIKLQNRSPPASEAERKSSADNGDRDPQPLDLGLRAQIRTAFQLLADRVLSLMGLVAAGPRPMPLSPGHFRYDGVRMQSTYRQ
jgi:hypothetical protein